MQLFPALCRLSCVNTPNDITKADVETLVEAARGPIRNTVAYAALVDRHRAMVYGLIHASCGDWSEAQDLTQEVFIKAWEKLTSLREPARFAPWLRQIARSVTLDAIRRRRHPAATDDEEIESDETPEGVHEMDETARAWSL